MAGDIPQRWVRVCWSVARRYPAYPCCGHEDMVSAALERLAKSLQRSPAIVMNDALVSTIARRAIIDELRRFNLIGRERAKGEDGKVVVRAYLPDQPVSIDALRGSDDAIPWSGHDRIAGREDESRNSLREATIGLSERQRRIVVLLGLGYSMREIGGELGVTESRISQLVHGIRIHIRGRGGS